MTRKNKRAAMKKMAKWIGWAFKHGVLVCSLMLNLYLTVLRYEADLNDHFHRAEIHRENMDSLAAQVQPYKQVAEGFGDRMVAKAKDVNVWIADNVQLPDRFPIPWNDPNRVIHHGFGTSGHTGMPSFHAGVGTLQVGSVSGSGNGSAGGLRVLNMAGLAQSGPATVSGTLTVS